MFILKSIKTMKEVLKDMRTNPSENTDIVTYAQNIINNYAGINTRCTKYVKSRRKKSRIDTALWVAAGVLSALTLSLYIFMR